MYNNGSNEEDYEYEQLSSTQAIGFIKLTRYQQAIVHIDDIPSVELRAAMLFNGQKQKVVYRHEEVVINCSEILIFQNNPDNKQVMCSSSWKNIKPRTQLILKNKDLLLVKEHYNTILAKIASSSMLVNNKLL